jgi:hypothetical protein
MDTEKIVQKATKVNSEIQIVLDIAARAREAEAIVHEWAGVPNN